MWPFCWLNFDDLRSTIHFSVSLKSVFLYFLFLKFGTIGRFSVFRIWMEMSFSWTMRERASRMPGCDWSNPRPRTKFNQRRRTRPLLPAPQTGTNRFQMQFFKLPRPKIAPGNDLIFRNNTCRLPDSIGITLILRHTVKNGPYVKINIRTSYDKNWTTTEEKELLEIYKLFFKYLCSSNTVVQRKRKPPDLKELVKDFLFKYKYAISGRRICSS